MDREELRDFFADVRSILHISLGPWLDRNDIFRSDFSNFMKGKYNNVSNEDLMILKDDLMHNLESFMKIYKKVA